MRLTGLWWWIDRWRKSSAFRFMTLEEQGAYRNLLDSAALSGGVLPNDERILARECGDAVAWKRLRPALMPRFQLRDDGWHNETLDEVLKKSRQQSEKQRKYRNSLSNGMGNEEGNAGGNER